MTSAFVGNITPFQGRVGAKRICTPVAPSPLLSRFKSVGDELRAKAVLKDGWYETESDDGSKSDGNHEIDGYYHV